MTTGKAIALTIWTFVSKVMSLLFNMLSRFVKAFSNEVKVKVLVAQLYLALCNTMDCPWHSPGKNTGVGCHFLLQGNLPHPGIEPASPVSALAGRFFTTSATCEDPSTQS